MSAFTDLIDLELKKRKIGKYKFYEDVGISAMTFSKWKSGENFPSMKNVKRISEYLGIPVSTLIDLDSPKETEKTAAPEGNGLSDAQIELLTIARSLDADALRFLTTKARELAEFQRFRDGQ